MTRMLLNSILVFVVGHALATTVQADQLTQPEEIFTHQFLGGNPGVIQSAGDHVLIPSPGEELGFWSTAGDADTAVRINIVAPEGPAYQTLRFSGSQTLRTAERFYFSVARSVSSAPLDLWVTDGTPGGTYRIVNTQAIGLANNSASLRYLAEFGDTIAFAARVSELDEDRVFVVDESAPDNVIQVPGLQPFTGAARDRMRELGGNLYVSSTAGGDRSLWRVDPGSFTATQVWSMGGTSTNRVAPANLMTAGGILYFRARDDSGFALWRLASGANGAERLHDPAPTPPDEGSMRGSTRLLAADSRLYFFASQWDTSNPKSPFWRNDLRLATSLGTPVSTATWWREDLGSGWNASTVSNDEFGTAGDRLIFKSPTTADGGRQWWRTDGTEQGTQPIVIDGDTIPAPGQPFGTGATLTEDENGVWISDVQDLGVSRRMFFIGSTDGQSFAVPGEYNRVENFHAHAGRFWFTVQAPVGGNRSVWRFCPSCAGDAIFMDRFESTAGAFAGE